MEQWEYYTIFLWANIEHKGVQEYLKKIWPDWNPPKYTPQAMIPELNAFGEEGWELIHREPIHSTGRNFDVGFDTGGGSPAATHWSNVYFCVFKRRKQENPSD